MKKRSYKRILTAALSLVLLFALFQFAMSDDADLYDFTVTSGQATITGYLGDSLVGAVSIPSTVSIFTNNYPVVAIADNAFADMSGITGVTIPSGVTSIGAYAFYGCTSIASVSIPDTVTSIGACAFWGCSSLAAVNLPAGVVSVGEAAFGACPLVTSVSIPSTLTTLSKNIFSQCAGLTAISIPATVTTIQDGAFSFCSSLSSATFLGNAPTMGDHVFDGCADPFTVHYSPGMTGFSSEWHGYAAKCTSYIVSFPDWNGGMLEQQDIEHGQPAVQPPDPVRTGYTFGGWFQDEACLTTWTFATDLVTAATTIYAKWTINAYTITFDSAGGTTVASITQSFGTAITAPASPTRTGYAFAGWSPSLPSTMPAGGAALTAQWTINAYTITFNSAGGSAVTSITQNFGTAITAPANPTRTGFTFAGWSPALPSTMPAGGLTLYAQWTINQYTISFNSAGGTAVTSITQNFGTTITAPANPTRSGYTFAGWSPTLPATMPAGGAALTAQWTSSVPASISSSTFACNTSTGFISNISPGTTVATLVNGINEKLYIKIFKDGTEVSGDMLAGTGMEVRLMNSSTIVQTLTVVITGDISGDGKISLTDYIQMKSHLLGISPLTGAKALAGDINGNGTITLTDFIKMKEHLLGISTIISLSY